MMVIIVLFVGVNTLVVLLLNLSCTSTVYRFLPVLSMNCTAVRVKIQHEGSIHPGPCSDVCQQQLMQVSNTHTVYQTI